MKIELQSPYDMHLHLREGAMLECVAPLSAVSFAGAVIMPNLREPVTSLDAVLAYREEIALACGAQHFEPMMTLFFREYSKQELIDARPHILGIKLYPAGITTGSDAGVRDLDRVYPTLSIMEELGIPLLVHGESNGFVMDREREFLTIYKRFAQDFPNLHIIMEHITTAAAIDFLDRYGNISATVTLHHLLITLDDVAGKLLEPDLFCKPIAKTPRDRDALREAVYSGHPKLMFGSDSAPHPRSSKECCGCAAGIFSAPVALPMLVQLFEEEGCLDLLQGFVCDIACSRYGFRKNTKRIALERQDWTVPQLYTTVRPFLAGTTLRWRIARSHENGTMA